eukprot:364965-Chlamydomonas_euryale.AAC.9
MSHPRPLAAPAQPAAAYKSPVWPGPQRPLPDSGQDGQDMPVAARAATPPLGLPDTGHPRPAHVEQVHGQKDTRRR